MKRASYRHAVALIALNDSSGDDDNRDVNTVSELVSVVIVADIFGVTVLKLAEDIVRYRNKHEED